MLRVNFQCTSRTTTVPHNFSAATLLCEVTLIKKYNKPLLQKSETKVFKQKKFIKKLFKVNEQIKLGRFELKLDNV